MVVAVRKDLDSLAIKIQQASLIWAKFGRYILLMRLCWLEQVLLIVSCR
jgi:hypothetical protein